MALVTNVYIHPPTPNKLNEGLNFSKIQYDTTVEYKNKMMYLFIGTFKSTKAD